MSIRTVIIIILAVVFGGSAAVGVNTLRNAAPPAEAPPPDTVDVVVAAVDVPRFASLTPDMLKIRKYPKETVPEGCPSRVEDVVERVALFALVKDDLILDGKLAPRGTGRGMAPGIPKGMRAHTIQTPNVATSVAGFILPGNRVDVQLVFTGNEGPGNLPASLVLLQDVEILAVDQRVDAATDSKFDPNQLRSVTLLVTPDQSLKLTLAQNKGTLQLSLRNPEDKALVSIQMAQLKDLGVGMLPEKVVEKPVETPKPAEIVPVAAPPVVVPPARVRTLRSTYPGWTELD